MTKKGAVLTLILVILIIAIIIVIVKQDNIPDAIIPQEVEKKQEDTSIFVLQVTDKTGLDLEELKSYKIPIILQLMDDKDEICTSMQKSIETLNEETRGKAIVKSINVEEYPEILSNAGISGFRVPTQVLIDSNGNPYKTEESISAGFKLIKDEITKEHIFTFHDGDLTLNQMRDLIEKMK